MTETRFDNPLVDYYGTGPVSLGEMTLDGWDEFMHYLYLPVRIPNAAPRAGGEEGAYAIPQRLQFLTDAVVAAVTDARVVAPHLANPHVYITARRGFASPGNPLNRPGWHCDDFGGTDLNYIWSDRFPTRFLTSNGPLTIPADDEASMETFHDLAFQAEHTHAPSLSVEDGPERHLLRLTPYVIHDTPVIPEPGGMRSFFKISVSTHRYNLLGNSRNHLLNYDWVMWDRRFVRNQPSGNGDYYEGEPTDAR